MIFVFVFIFFYLIICALLIFVHTKNNYNKFYSRAPAFDMVNESGARATMKLNSCDSNKAKQTMMESLTESKKKNKNKKKTRGAKNAGIFQMMMVFNSNANYCSSNTNKE